MDKNINEKLRKPRRTRGTPFHIKSNFYTIGFLALGGVTWYLFELWPGSQKLRERVQEGKYKYSPELRDHIETVRAGLFDTSLDIALSRQRLRKEEDEEKRTEQGFLSKLIQSKVDVYSREPETTSKFFTNKKENVNNEDEFDSPYKERVTEQKALLNDTASDENDFKTPKNQKKLSQKQLINQKPKMIRKKTVKKPTRSKSKQPTLIKLLENQFSHSDVNPDQLQMAIALSKSEQETQDLKDNVEDVPLVLSTQQKVANIKVTLQQFGFKSNKKRTENNFERLKRSKASKYRHVTPILFLRKPEHREIEIVKRISMILSQNVSSVEAKRNEYYLSSDYLQSILNVNTNYFQKNNLDLNLQSKENYYLEYLNIPRSTLKCGSLLKDWTTIPGREKSPDRVIGRIERDKEMSPDLFESENNEEKSEETTETLTSVKNITSQSFKSEENITSQSFRSEENITSESLKSEENITSQSIRSEENAISQSLKSRENRTSQSFRSEDNITSQSLRLEENITSKPFKSEENITFLSLKLEENITSQPFQSEESITSLSLRTEENITSQSLRAEENISQLLRSEEKITSQPFKLEENVTSQSLKAQKNITSQSLSSEKNITSQSFRSEENLTAQSSNGMIGRSMSITNSSKSLQDSSSESDCEIIESNKGIEHFESYDLEADAAIDKSQKYTEYLFNKSESDTDDFNLRSLLDEAAEMINRVSYNFKNYNSTLMNHKLSSTENVQEESEILSKRNYSFDLSNGYDKTQDLNVTEYVNKICNKTNDLTEVYDNDLVDLTQDSDDDLGQMNSDHMTEKTNESFDETDDYYTRLEHEEYFKISINTQKYFDLMSGTENMLPNRNDSMKFEEIFSSNYSDQNKNIDFMNDLINNPIESDQEELEQIEMFTKSQSPKKFEKFLSLDQYVCKPMINNVRKSLSFGPPKGTFDIKQTNIKPLETNSDSDCIYISDEEINYSSVISTPSNKSLKTNPELIEKNMIGIPANYTPKILHKRIHDLTKGNFETPKRSLSPDNIVIKTGSVTPLPDYDRMNTPTVQKELEKIGVKNLKRQRGIQILKHVYESTHPVLNSDQSEDSEDDRTLKKRKILSDISENCLKVDSDSGNSQNYQKEMHIERDGMIDIVGDISESVLIFERNQSKRIQSCALPLHIAWHNFLASNPEIKESILLYIPLQLEVLYSMLKQQGFRYHIQDLLTYLDKKCITIRTNQLSYKQKKIKLKENK